MVGAIIGIVFVVGTIAGCAQIILDFRRQEGRFKTRMERLTKEHVEEMKMIDPESTVLFLVPIPRRMIDKLFHRYQLALYELRHDQYSFMKSFGPRASRIRIRVSEKEYFTLKLKDAIATTNRDLAISHAGHLFDPEDLPAC